MNGKWFEKGDLVRYPHGTRLGVVHHTRERLNDDGKREVCKMLIRFGSDELHTILGRGINEIVLVRESMEMGKKREVGESFN